MKTGRTLPALAAELERQAHAKRDLLAPAHSLHVHSNAHTALCIPTIEQTYSVNDIAHGQFAEYLGIPRGFYDFLRARTEALRVPVAMSGVPPTYKVRAEPGQLRLADEQSLFDVTVNRLLQSKSADKRLVRLLDGSVRAFLSKSYSLDLDNFDVFAMAARVIEEIGLCPDDVVSCEVTERRLYLKVVSPKLAAVIHPHQMRTPGGMLKEPQIVQAGFVLTNSETGLGSLCIRQVVYKLLCQNGWIHEEAYRKRHLGRALEADESGDIYRSDTRRAEAKARLLKIRDQVADTLGEHKFLTLVQKMQASAAVPIEGEVTQVVDVTARKFCLHEDERASVLRNLIEGADLSLWGLSNAITATAQTVGSYDRATELESIGGRCFALSGSEIKEIVTAR